MADRIHPSAKPAAAPPPKPLAVPPPPHHRRPPNPNPKPRRRRRSCCCSLCLWLSLLLIIVVVLAAVAGGVLYVVYRPHKPRFTLNAVQLQTLNISSSNLVTSRLAVNLTVTNPNDKLDLYYDDLTITAAAAGVPVGGGSLPGFSQAAGGPPVFLAARVAGDGVAVDSAAAARVRGRGRVAVAVGAETAAAVRVGGLKTRRVSVRVRCGAVEVEKAAGTKKAAAASPNEACDVTLRFRVWRWYI